MNQKRLDTLSPEQEKHLDAVADDWIKFVNGGDTSIDEKAATASIKEIYYLANLKEPGVAFFNGPVAALKYCNEVLKQPTVTFDWFGCGYDAGWVSFYDFFQRIGVLDHSDPGFEATKAFLRSGVWATVLYDELAVCIARPKLVKMDEAGKLHCADGPAIVFDDGYKEYVWHNTFVDEKVIMRPKELTADEIRNERNSEVSRAIAERLGWDQYMAVLGTYLVDKWEQATPSHMAATHKDIACSALSCERASHYEVVNKPMQVLHYELYDFKERKFDLMPRLLKMESPETHDGTRPFYIEPVHPGLNTCQAARKWQFKKADGEWPAVSECNINPVLAFETEA